MPMMPRGLLIKEAASEEKRIPQSKFDAQRQIDMPKDRCPSVFTNTRVIHAHVTGFLGEHGLRSLESDGGGDGGGGDGGGGDGGGGYGGGGEGGGATAAATEAAEREVLVPTAREPKRLKSLMLSRLNVH